MKSTDTWSCNCIGPQDGEAYCPCMLRAKAEQEKILQYVEYTNKKDYTKHE